MTTKGRKRRKARRAERHSTLKHQARASGAIVASVVGSWAAWLGRFYRKRRQERREP